MKTFPLRHVKLRTGEQFRDEVDIDLEPLLLALIRISYFSAAKIADLMRWRENLLKEGNNAGGLAKAWNFKFLPVNRIVFLLK